MKRFVFISILAALLLSGCGFVDYIKGYAESFKAQKLPKQEMVLETAASKVELTLEVADEPEERSKGLMYRQKLKDGRGMLFIFPDEEPRTFWMKNTKIPLDILFLNKNKTVIHVVENVTPCTTEECEHYLSVAPAMYALELPADFVKEKGIKVGDKLVDTVE